MVRFPVRSAVVLLLFLPVRSPAAEPLAVAHGRVVKANANIVILRPVVAGGRLGDAIVLKLTGTSRVSVASVQQRDGQPVVVQREIEAKNLRPDQLIAAVFTTVDREQVLLSAVAQAPASGK